MPYSVLVLKCSQFLMPFDPVQPNWWQRFISVDGLSGSEDADHFLAFVAGTGLGSTCGHSARVLTSGGFLPLS